MKYVIMKLIRRVFHLGLWSDPCHSCSGASYRGSYVGDGFHEPRIFDADPCDDCAVQGLCPSCRSRLSEGDADRMFSERDEPCPFCRWTMRAGEQRRAKLDHEDDASYEDYWCEPKESSND